MTRRRGAAAPAVWIAVAVLLLAALLPALLRIATADQPALWAEICSSAASSAKHGKAPADPLSTGDAEHCSWCRLQQAAPALPPQPVPLLALATGLRQALPERFLSAALTSHAWRAAPARAPPPRRL